MKFNWKSKAVIGGLLTVVLLGFGVPNYSVIAGFGTSLVCTVVTCA